MNKTLKESSEAHLFDLTAQIRKWAINMFYLTATKDQKRYDPSELVLRIVWDDIIVNHEQPDYMDSVIVKLPQSQSLFSTTFLNNTESPQEYCFRTERSTRSVAEVEIQKGVIISKEIGVKLALPNSVLEANAGFKREISLGSSNRQTNEEELSWSVDTNITVPQQSKATAEVRITEEEMSTRFRILTTMYGRIRATFVDPTHDNAFIKYIEGDLGSILNDGLKSYKKSPNSMQTINDTDALNVWTKPNSYGQNVVYIETFGKCKFRFGVHQNVEVNQVEKSRIFPNK